MNNDDSQQGQASHQPFTDDKETLTDLSSRHVSSDPELGLRGRVPPAIADHELLRCIGRGSYGEVWLARNVMGVYRAVKIVYRDSFESDRPYEREFAGIKKFEPISRRHESQVDILHVGRNDAAGYFYYVMELADDANAEFGVRSSESSEELPQSVLPSAFCTPHSYQPRTLRSELKRCGRLPFEACLDIALSLTTALQHLHTHGLIHRDIKPANIIFIEGRPKLADIGLVTETGKTLSFVGTEGYLPPEGPNSAQADIFSLGKVFYEICTGKDRLEFPDMPTFIDAVPEMTRLFEFNEVLIKACHNDLRKRYATAAQMHQDLLHSNTVWYAAFSLDGERVVTATEHEARVWNASTGQAISPPIRHGTGTPKAIPGSDKGAAQILEALAGAIVGPNLNHATRVGFTRDGRSVITAGADGTIQLWNPDSGEPNAPALDLHNKHLLAVSPDGRSVLTATDRTAYLSDIRTGEPLLPPIEHIRPIIHGKFNSTGSKVLAIGYPGCYQIWDTATGAVSPGRELYDADLSPDGQLAVVGGADGLAQILEPTTATLITSPLRHNGTVWGVRFDPTDGIWRQRMDRNWSASGT